MSLIDAHKDIPRDCPISHARNSYNDERIALGNRRKGSSLPSKLLLFIYKLKLTIESYLHARIFMHPSN
jgi:hypothetical protein